MAARRNVLAGLLATAIVASMVALLMSALPTTAAQAADAPPVEDMYPTGIRVTPIPGGATVEWDPVTVIGRIDLGGGYGGASVASRYFVTSSYDPATNSGYRTCWVPAPQTSCTVTGLVNGVSYTFQVKTDTRMIAHDSPTWTGPAPRWSDYSPPSAPAIPCCGAPSAVPAITPQVTGDVVDLTWTAPADWGGAQELDYTVTTADGTDVCATKATTCQVRGRPYGTPLAFTVRATNSGGTSAPATSGEVTIPPQAPQPPTSGRARYSRSGSATVSWQAPARDGGSALTGYRVRATPGNASCSTTGTTRCTIAGLPKGVAYTFTVQAQNRLGLSAPSAPIVAGRLVTPASAPRSVRADPTTSTVALTWARPSSSGGGRLKEYVVTEGQDVVCRTRKTRCTVTGLAPGSRHRFGVYAVNTSGQGRAATIDVTLPLPAIVAPAPPVQPGPPPSAPKPEQQLS